MHMKNILFTLFAIGLAGIAAMAATTAVLNAPVRPAYIGPPKSDQPATPGTVPPSTTPEPQPGTPPATPPATPPSNPAPGPAPESAPIGEKPAGAEAEPDEDPYGDIPQEELPPDLQYDADSSVSFPTNI
jgi:hypothetical protein